MTTVSRVLNNSARQIGISAETERRVREAARALAYQPNKAAKNLRLGREKRGVLFLYPAAIPFTTHPFFGRLLHAIHLALAKKGHYLVYLAADAANRVQLESILDEVVSGVITWGRMPDPIARVLSRHPLPTVPIAAFQASDPPLCTVAPGIQLAQLRVAASGAPGPS